MKDEISEELTADLLEISYQFRHIGRVQKPRIPIVGCHDLPKRR